MWLVKVRAVRRIGDTIWSPEFVVQTQPNDWEAEVRRQTSHYLASLDEFYDKCAADGGVDWADDARTVIEHWLNLGEAEVLPSPCQSRAMQLSPATQVDDR